MTDRRAMILRYFATYAASDRGAIEHLLSPDFTFSSPLDERLDREAFFTRCWSRRSGETRTVTAILVDGDDAVARYDGAAEHFHFAGDKIASVELYHGAQPQPVKAIETVLEQRQNALEMKDARLLAHKQTQDAVMFLLAPPLVVRSEPEAMAEAWFKTWAGPLTWEMRDQEVTVAGDVAFVTALEHMAGTKTDGEDVSLWFRTTLGLKRLDGAWKIVHEHQSVPFYMDGSDRAALDLTPESHGSWERAAPEDREYLA